jgi:hypothetical protein
LNYMATRPGSFVPGTDPASVARRNRFAMAGRASSSIYNIDKLKSLWNIVNPSGKNAYNDLLKINYRFVSATGVSDLLQMTPDYGFGVVITDNYVDRTHVQITLDPIGSNAGINPALEPNMMMVSLVFLSSPVDLNVYPYSFIGVSSVPQATNLVTALTFDANLTNQQQQIFDKYQSVKTFVALLTLDADGNPVHYSSTALLQ